MTMFWLSMLFIILGNVIYHLSQKAIPATANPVASVLVSYAVAMLFSLLLLPKYLTGTSFAAALRTLNWSSVLVGVSIVAIEFGFLLAYRAGWQINLAALLASVAIALLLLPIGVLAFREHWSWSKTLGLVCCVLGLILLNRK